MKTLNFLTKKTKLTIENGNYYINAQYCYPESVTQEALDTAEETAEAFILNAPGDIIEKYCKESLKDNGNDTTVETILTTMADENCDHSGYETITPVVSLKNN